MQVFLPSQSCSGARDGSVGLQCMPVGGFFRQAVQQQGHTIRNYIVAPSWVEHLNSQRSGRKNPEERAERTLAPHLVQPVQGLPTYQPVLLTTSNHLPSLLVKPHVVWAVNCQRNICFERYRVNYQADSQIFPSVVWHTDRQNKHWFSDGLPPDTVSWRVGCHWTHHHQTTQLGVGAHPQEGFLLGFLATFGH